MHSISRKSLTFLKELKENNDRTWFNENKDRYEDAREEFIHVVQDLILEVGKFDPAVRHLDPKKCIFRIYRDVRFSKNKAPYKTALSARLTPTTTEEGRGAGYYVHIEPGNCVLAGGAYHPPKEWLAAIREEIDYDATPLRKVLARKTFKDHFGQLEGDQLKTAPKGYDRDHPDIDLLRHKSFVAYHRMRDSKVTAKSFVADCGKVFKALKPLNDFLNTAMSE